MSLAPVPLDDLTWNDLTTAIRARIPAASRGRWTLHAPVDPGVTLLELHAWLLEQRLYWMDQVPDSLLRGTLALLGDAERDAQAAVTVMHFPSGEHPVPPATKLLMADSDPPLIFTTENAMAPLPLAPPLDATVRPRVGLRNGAREFGPVLAAGQPVCLFDGVPEALIALWLKAGPPAGAEATLLLLLDSPVPAAWDAKAVAGIAPAAQISWWYAGPQGTRKSLSVQDDTEGLRRSGIVQFSVPADWAGGADDNGNRPFVLWLRAETSGFAAPPSLTGIWPNVAVARHVQAVARREELDWLKLPGNQIALDPSETAPLMAGTQVRLKEADGWHAWKPVTDLAFQGPGDRVFVIDRARRTFRFGNGETGRIPVLDDRFTTEDILDAAALQPRLGPELDPPGLLLALNALLATPLQNEPGWESVRAATKRLKAETPGKVVRPRLNRLLLEDAFPTALARGRADIQAQLGGGRIGNVAAWRRWEPAAPDTTVPQAINVIPGQGGDDPEPLEAARQRSAGAIRQINRAVLATDYEAIARKAPGVAIARAHAAIGTHPDFPCLKVPGVVTVFVVPAAPRDGNCGIVAAPVPDKGALAAVAKALDAARLLGTEVLVRAPIYQKLILSLTVQAEGAPADQVRRAVETRLIRFLDPLAGGEDGAGWPFGDKLRPSELLRQAQDALGRSGRVVDVAITLPDARPPVTAESCRDVDLGPDALPALSRIAIRLVTGQAGTGGLT